MSWVTNLVFARVFRVPANQESIYITALIVALIMSPVTLTDTAGIGALVFASVWAMAGKFVFAVGRKHVFNPAAFGVVLPALLLGLPATWWVGGNLPLLPVVLAGGVLIVRKLQRLDLIAVFMTVVLATTLATTDPSHWAMAIKETLVHSPLFFFAFVMLTEPLTAADDTPAPARLRRAGGLPLRAQRPYRLVLFHAGDRAHRRQRLRLGGQPQGTLRADA